MNARGIAVFYGATHAKVALAETRPPVGSRVLVGRFEITRPLKLLDDEALRSIYVKGSVFDSTWLDRLKKAKFLGDLSHRITMPGLYRWADAPEILAWRGWRAPPIN
jgi:RES domain